MSARRDNIASASTVSRAAPPLHEADRRKEAARRRQSRFAVIASIAANVAIALTKFIVAAVSGSTAMLAEGVHSLSNCFDGTLLLLGERRSRRTADETHPFGYGRELYFWSFVVAVVFFTLGAGVTVYEGIHHVLHPPPLRAARWSYIVLAVAAVFDGASFAIGFKQFRRHSRGRSYWRTIRDSKNPTLISVVLEDVADLLGLACAFFGVFLSHALRRPELDGVASIAIGGILAALAVILLIETHGLLIGESADPSLVQAVRETAAACSPVMIVDQILTVHTGPDEVVLILRLVFQPTVSAGEIQGRSRDLEQRLRRAHPALKRIFFAVG